MAENDDGTKPNTLTTEKVIPPQDQTVQGSKRKEVSTVQMTVIRLTRTQLYDEIWEISAAGTAKKYDIPYSQFLKQIKEANIPIPPSGYWTKISFWKPVEKTALKKPFDKVVSLVKEVSLPKGEKPEPGSDPNKKLSDQQEKVRQLSVSSTVVQEQQVPDETHKVDVVAELFQEPETIKQWGQTYNVYDRETLYKEVWAAPVTEVAKKYKVSDVAIHKVCQLRHRGIGQNSGLESLLQRHRYLKAPRLQRKSAHKQDTLHHLKQTKMFLSFWGMKSVLL